MGDEEKVVVFVIDCSSSYIIYEVDGNTHEMLTWKMYYPQLLNYTQTIRYVVHQCEPIISNANKL